MLYSKNNVNYVFILSSLFLSIQLISYFKTIGFPVNLTFVVTVLWLIGFIFSNKRILIIKFTIEDLCVLIYMTSVLIALLKNIGYLVNSDRNTLLSVMSALLLCPFSYFLARNLNYRGNKFALKKIVVTCVFASLVFTALRIALPELTTEDASIYGSQYQYSGDSLAILILLFYSIDGARSIRLMLPLYFLSIALTGSRASFLSFVIAIIFMKNGIKFILILAFIIMFYFAYFNFNFDSIVSSLDFSRTFVTLAYYFLPDNPQDSLQSRTSFTLAAIDIVANNPILGNISYSDTQEGPGAYAHNIIHLWAAYGLLAIISIITLFLFLYRRSILPFFMLRQRDYYNHISNNFHCEFSVLPLLIFLCVLLLFFRAPDNFLIFFALGAAVKIALENNKAIDIYSKMDA